MESVADVSCAGACSAGGTSINVPLATTARGGSVGGRISGLVSRSRLAISVSIWDRNSFEARFNSLRAYPTCRAISGSFFGPNTRSARKNRKVISEKLNIASSYCRSRSRATRPQRHALLLPVLLIRETSPDFPARVDRRSVGVSCLLPDEGNARPPTGAHPESHSPSGVGRRSPLRQGLRGKPATALRSPG